MLFFIRLRYTCLVGCPHVRRSFITDWRRGYPLMTFSSLLSLILILHQRTPPLLSWISLCNSEKWGREGGRARIIIFIFSLQVCNHPELFERRDVLSPISLSIPPLPLPRLLYHYCIRPLNESRQRYEIISSFYFNFIVTDCWRCSWAWLLLTTPITPRLTTKTASGLSWGLLI